MTDTMDKKWDAIEGFLSEVIREPDKYPDRLAVFVLTDEELHQLFTRERLRLLRALKEKEYESVTVLSEHLGRDKAAVTRDLKLLERHGLVRLEKEGRRVRPRLDKEGVYLPLAEPKPIRQV